MRESGNASVGTQLARILRDRIARRRYSLKVPTEGELMEEFGMSRYAVRAALLQLERDGLIERRPRRGTVVIAVPREKSPWAIRSVEDLIDRNLLEQPRVLSAKAVSASRFPDYATLFGIARRGQVFVIERVSRGEPGERAFYSVNAMRLEDGKALSRRDIGLEPLIVQIEKACRIRAYRVRQEIEGGQASLPAAQHLGIPPGHPTVVVRRTYFAWEGTPIVTADLHYRLELFRQSIDLFRENVSS